MDSQSTKAIKLFYCYAREDKLLRDELEKHLSVLKRRSFITTWYDQEIMPGEAWKQAINAHLETADVVLLLISPDFMNSDYCYGIEMQRALERHAQKETHVVPIILRPVYWEAAPFSHLQVLPTDGKPVNSSFWHNRDEAFANIVSHLRKVVDALSSNPAVSPPWELSRQAPLPSNLHAQDQQTKKPTSQPDSTSTTQKTPGQWQDEGNSHFNAKQYEEAIADYNHALALNPKSAGLYFNRGMCYSGLQQFQRAIADYTQALALEPNYPGAEKWREEVDRLRLLVGE